MFDGLFDDLIEMLDFNFLWPTIGWFQDLMPHTCFGVSLFAGFTRRKVRKALEGAGVNAWGFDDDAGRHAIIFNVQEDHTQLALDTLEEAQVPVLYPKWSTKKASNNFLVRLFEAIERYA